MSGLLLAKEHALPERSPPRDKTWTRAESLSPPRLLIDHWQALGLLSHASISSQSASQAPQMLPPPPAALLECFLCPEMPEVSPFQPKIALTLALLITWRPAATSIPWCLAWVPLSAWSRLTEPLGGSGFNPSLLEHPASSSFPRVHRGGVGMEAEAWGSPPSTHRRAAGRPLCPRPGPASSSLSMDLWGSEGGQSLGWVFCFFPFIFLFYFSFLYFFLI